jgi:Zn-dependent peptidase ImmA (M78 family)/transcriptional regulator with XRE-family HTH domain
MERIHSINPDRIAWCCADFGITPEQLAAEINISTATIEKVLSRSEGSGLTFNQLSKLAAFFGRGVLFFMEQTPVEPERVHTSAFRTLANQKPELSPKLKLLIERVEQQRSIFSALRDEMDDVDLPRFIHPNLPKNIEEVALVVRQWLGVGPVNTFETYRKAIEDKGILVFRSNGYNGKWQIASDSPILGFSIYDPECPVIVVKKMYSNAQLTFTLMHELGHLLLHKESSIDDESDLYAHRGAEQEANAFAGLVLVPNDFLRRINDAARPDDVSEYDEWLSQNCRHWGVSTEVILRRLLDSGRLSQQSYAAYRRWRAGLPVEVADSGTRMFRHREPKNIFGDNFVRTVLGALNGRRITLSKASTYLDGLSLNDLHKLERHYASI